MPASYRAICDRQWRQLAVMCSSSSCCRCCSPAINDHEDSEATVRNESSGALGPANLARSFRKPNALRS